MYLEDLLPYIFAAIAGLAGWFTHMWYQAKQLEKLKEEKKALSQEVATAVQELNRHREASKETITRLESAKANLLASNIELKEELAKLTLFSQINDTEEAESPAPSTDTNEIIPDSTQVTDPAEAKKSKRKKNRRRRLKRKLSKANQKIATLQDALKNIKPEKIHFVKPKNKKKKPQKKS